MRLLLFLFAALLVPARAADPYAPLAAMLPGRAHLFLSAIAAPEAGADFDAQARAVLARLDARLQAAGLHRDALVYLHAYLLDAPAEAAWHQHLLDYLPHPPLHTRATVLLALPASGSKLLLECLAAFPADVHPTCGEPTANPGLRTLFDPAAHETAGVVVEAATHLHTVNERVAFGDSTAAQASAVFGRLNVALTDEKLTLGDVVQIRATISPEDRAYDFAGWQKAFAHFFPDATAPSHPAVTIITSKPRADDHVVAVDFVVAARNLPAPRSP